ncbi:glutamate receptor 2.7 [Cryptomeria japonica]|uniref:glutamate receptor 2.7 n=1 Tax=Cryptomeria japonica TaxID=3369 RepID=UPI0025AB7E00|nr:glutamate receptor 2.7 [Cryptomeria japonica]
MGSSMPTIFICIYFICCCCCCSRAQNLTVNIGVIYQLDAFGKVVKPAFELAAEDANKNFEQQNSSIRLVLHFKDSGGDPVLAASAGAELLQSGAVAIIGPQTSQEAGFVAQMCVAAQVPMLSFSATDPLLSYQRFPYFIRLPHSDAVQMKAIAAVVDKFEWKQVVALYADNDFGSGVLSPLSEALVKVGSEISYRCPIPNNASKDYIRAELYKLMTMQTRVFVVHVSFELGQTIFSVATDIRMMGADYVWIITDGFSSLVDTLKPSDLDSMKGALATRALIKNSSDIFPKRWKEKFKAEFTPKDKVAKINMFAYYAYDSVSIIARALQQLNVTRFEFSPVPRSPRTELTGNKIFAQGERLMKLLLQMNYKGLSGQLRATSTPGELSDSPYEILNVVGGSGADAYPTVGLWKNGSGIGILSGLENVTWPGGSKNVPRGWAAPVDTTEELKIAVPVRRGFDQFVVTSHDRDPKITGGFVIDVFEEVVKGLPYALSYKFFPVGDSNFTPVYDNLVQRVYTKEFDGMVGDVTILANRSNFVDFTQPYSESGLVMVVPVRKVDTSNAWAFLRPFTPGMWIATGSFFLFTGIVVWVLEHKRNTTFRGIPRRQIVTMLWFSFSTLFFSQRERIVSSLARGVVIVWLFVVLILTSSYTASLTSILTVQQMKPTVTDVQFLLNSRAHVGYQRGSFVGHYLQEQLGFRQDQLHEYNSPQEYAQALSKDPKDGGVAAIFDEIPYIRIFLSSQCGFTIAGPVYRTGGLGFVFQKGSPLVSEISRSVLELSESAEMQRLQNKWFNMTECTKPGAQVDSNRLSMQSFWGLYLITGTASIVALLLFLGRLIYNYTRHNPAPEGPSISAHVKSFVNYMDQEESYFTRKSRSSLPGSNGNNNDYSSNSRPMSPFPATGSPMSPFPAGESPMSLTVSDTAGRPSSASWVSIDLDSEIEHEQVNENSHHYDRDGSL